MKRHPRGTSWEKGEIALFEVHFLSFIYESTYKGIPISTRHNMAQCQQRKSEVCMMGIFFVVGNDDEKKGNKRTSERTNVDD
jgi:hypothetical protein